MSPGLPAGAIRIGQALAASAGGYLHSVVKAAGVTCRVCATPIDVGYSACYLCHTRAGSGLRLADRSASMVYAVKSPGGHNDQTYTAMYGYKGARRPVAQTELVSSLLGLGIVGHLECDIKLSGMRRIQWATVPGRRHRDHPFPQLVAQRISPAGLDVPIRMVRPGTTNDRALRPGDYEVQCDIPAGTHIAVFDDSWVTGSSAQSVAIALHQAGAASVSVLTVARVLTEGFGPTDAFLTSDRWRLGFDYRVCPWTGSACP